MSNALILAGVLTLAISFLLIVAALLLIRFMVGKDPQIVKAAQDSAAAKEIAASFESRLNEVDEKVNQAVVSVADAVQRNF